MALMPCLRKPTLMVLREIAEFAAAIDMIIDIRAAAPARRSRAIKSWREFMDALERREALAGCLEGSPEEQELIALQAAIESWQTRHGLR